MFFLHISAFLFCLDQTFAPASWNWEHPSQFYFWERPSLIKLPPASLVFSYFFLSRFAVLHLVFVISKLRVVTLYILPREYMFLWWTSIQPCSLILLLPGSRIPHWLCLRATGFRIKSCLYIWNYGLYPPFFFPSEISYRGRGGVNTTQWSPDGLAAPAPPSVWFRDVKRAKNLPTKFPDDDDGLGTTMLARAKQHMLLSIILPIL